MDLKPQGIFLQILTSWTWLSFCLAVLHSHLPCETGQPKEQRSTDTPEKLGSCSVVEDGQKRKFGGRNLPNQEHVFVLWLVLAQGCIRALFPAVGTEGAQFASIAGSCTRPIVVVLACPGHHFEPRKNLFLSSAFVSLVRELWRQSPSNCIFYGALGLWAEDLLDCDSFNSPWFCYTLHLYQKKWYSISVSHPSDPHSPLPHLSSS